MLNPTRKWTSFTSEEEKLLKYKQWGLSSPKADFIRALTYKGSYSKEPVSCDLVGFVDDIEVIIQVNGELHSIHPVCLLEMQEGRAVPSEIPFTREVMK